ncbi:MAG: S-adenosylmethionine:tRNA ribosyltransferase-isomerase [Chitinophagaceae bacterium]|nr:S-adenosylmethionine:tRNA ribosyltransferase-isomerase [Chitinophagaceae bacterium]
MHPGNISIHDYSYDLPQSRIARYPLEQRDASKLLIWEKEKITEDRYANIASHLPENSLLVFNNTKVVEARLLFQKAGGSMIEIFCLEPDEQYRDITAAMQQSGKVIWKCLVGGAKKWKENPLVRMIGNGDQQIRLEADKIKQLNDSYLVELRWNADLSFAELLHLAGAVPLPPYLERAVEDSDKERYQTIYARHDGSVAAPTAGLHFTDKIFRTLQQKNIGHDFVTLHVGAGTFKPVKAALMSDHEMHAEFIDVRRELVARLLEHESGTIVAVGTTSLRTLESLYWLGVKTALDPWILQEELRLSQWEAYELEEKAIPVQQALRSLLHWMDHQQTDRILTKTQIIIAPGYIFRVISALVTNFHQPQSTLLLLVAAIAGDNWKKIYGYALLHDFRFLSYGDGSLLWL